MATFRLSWPGFAAQAAKRWAEVTEATSAPDRPKNQVKKVMLQPGESAGLRKAQPFKG
jgi:hypothetical protein